METITLPVVAHRMYGLEHREGQVWGISSKVPADDPFRRMGWPAGVRRKGLEPRELESDRGAEQPIEMVSGEALWVMPGTRRSVDEIRDLFDGGHRAVGTGDEGINHFWEQAGISFRLVAIVDHGILSGLHYAIGLDRVKQYVGGLNEPGVVNLYFFRSLIGGAGVGQFSPLPLQQTRQQAYAAVEDWEEIAYMPWQSTLRIAAHELGHLLTLRHDDDADNLMLPYVVDLEPTLRPLQIMVAREHARQYLPATRRLSLADEQFRGRLRDPNLKPFMVRAYLGERLCLGKRR
jgi:hypothetical protein